MTNEQKERITPFQPPQHIVDNATSLYADRDRAACDSELATIRGELNGLFGVSNGFTRIEDNAGIPGDSYGDKKHYVATKVAQRNALRERINAIEAEERKAADEKAAAENLPTANEKKQMERIVPVLRASGGNPFKAMARQAIANATEAGARKDNFPKGHTVTLESEEIFGPLSLNLSRQIFNAGEVHSTGASTAGLAQLDVNLPLIVDQTGTGRPVFFAGMLPVEEVEGGKTVAYRARKMSTNVVQTGGKLEPGKRSGAPDGADQASRQFNEWYTKGDKETVDVQMRGGISKITLEELMDEALLASELRMLMTQDLSRDVDDQLINGNGTDPNVRGLFNVNGINTVSLTDRKNAKFTGIGLSTSVGEDVHGIEVLWAMADEIYVKGRTVPNFVLMNPSDVTNTLRAKDSQNRFVFDVALRSQAGTGERPNMLDLGLGFPVYKNDVITRGRVAMGNTNLITLLANGGVGFDMTNSDGDDFKAGVVSLRVYRRYAPLWHRPLSLFSVSAGYANTIKTVA